MEVYIFSRGRGQQRVKKTQIKILILCLEYLLFQLKNFQKKTSIKKSNRRDDGWGYLSQENIQPCRTSFKGVLANKIKGVPVESESNLQ